MKSHRLQFSTRTIDQSRKVLSYAGIYALLVFPLRGAEAGRIFKLQPEAATSLAQAGAKLPSADRIEIYVTGARLIADQMNRVSTLRKRAPDFVVKDQSEIAQLVALLRPKGNKPEAAKGKASYGLTYHLLAFNDHNGTVLHIRVFNPDDSKKGPAQVFTSSLLKNPILSGSRFTGERDIW